jgi:hypothetical protein
LIVYGKSSYLVYRFGKEFIIHNREKNFRQGHTHIRSYNVCKTIIDNLIKRKLPKTRNYYLLRSHIRLSTDDKYSTKIETLIHTRKNKGTPGYRNINTGVKK